MGKCKTKRCKNKARERIVNGRKHIYSLCRTCESRKYRALHPMEASYIQLKSNAKRRKKIFTITFEYFKQFCYETDYIRGKGKSSTSYSIDCIDPTKGYVPGNIQRLELGENSRKGAKVLQYDWQTKYATVSQRKISNDEDNPF